MGIDVYFVKQQGTAWMPDGEPQHVASIPDFYDVALAVDEVIELMADHKDQETELAEAYAKIIEFSEEDRIGKLNIFNSYIRGVNEAGEQMRAEGKTSDELPGPADPDVLTEESRAFLGGSLLAVDPIAPEECERLSWMYAVCAALMQGWVKIMDEENPDDARTLRVAIRSLEVALQFLGTALEEERHVYFDY